MIDWGDACETGWDLSPKSLRRKFGAAFSVVVLMILAVRAVNPDLGDKLMNRVVVKPMMAVVEWKTQKDTETVRNVVNAVLKAPQTPVIAPVMVPATVGAPATGGTLIFAPPDQPMRPVR